MQSFSYTEQKTDYWNKSLLKLPGNGDFSRCWLSKKKPKQARQTRKLSREKGEAGTLRQYRCHSLRGSPVRPWQLQTAEKAGIILIHFQLRYYLCSSFIHTHTVLRGTCVITIVVPELVIAYFSSPDWGGDEMTKLPFLWRKFWFVYLNLNSNVKLIEWFRFNNSKLRSVHNYKSNPYIYFYNILWGYFGICMKGRLGRPSFFTFYMHFYILFSVK